MSDGARQPIHEDAGRFRDALTYTASQTGFSARLIEKDYYCSVILDELAALFATGLVFKGGTALSKVHAEFYRLSEDLDFAVSIQAKAPPSQRRAAIEPIKQHLQQLIARSTFLQQPRGLAGADRRRQYTAALSYTSCLSTDAETVKVEISLREPLIEPSAKTIARTMLLDPFTTKPALQAVEVTVISQREAYAEKVRAALCRRVPAIRDLYDLDHAVQKQLLDPDETFLLDLARRKLAVPGNDPPDVSDARFAAVRRQVEAQLRPVLRAEDFRRFDLDRAFALIRRLDQRIRG